MTSATVMKIEDTVWNGTRYQPLYGRDIAQAFQVQNGFFWPMDARPEEVAINDIARGLSNESRFGNQSRFYSVAWHSVALSHYVPEELARWALMHDAAEAYLSDIPRVFKSMPEFDFYHVAEEKLMDVIAEAIGLHPIKEPKELKPYDVDMSHIEIVRLFGDLGIAKLQAVGYPEDAMRVLIDSRMNQYFRYLLPEEAEEAFLVRFIELFPEYDKQ